MIVFFTSSKSAKGSKRKIFDQIIYDIESWGHKVITLERMKYSALLDMEKAKRREHRISIHNQFIRKAIELSDASVFEASRYSFKLGQEVQISLDKKVPVLLLSDAVDYSQKVQDPYFYSEIYKDSNEIRVHLKNYFQTVKSKHLNKRVNVFLHNKHINYLDWYVRNHDGTNRSEVIRDALEKMMDEDKLYNKK